MLAGFVGWRYLFLGAVVLSAIDRVSAYRRVGAGSRGVVLTFEVDNLESSAIDAGHDLSRRSLGTQSGT